MIDRPFLILIQKSTPRCRASMWRHESLRWVHFSISTFVNNFWAGKDPEDIITSEVVPLGNTGHVLYGIKNFKRILGYPDRKGPANII